MTVEKIDRANCTGCGACMNLCPRKAISMEYDADGFLFPVINNEKCIQCGLCAKRCPTVDPDYSNTATPECYAVWGPTDIRLKSSSGGMFSLLAEYYLKMGAAVVGAVFSDDFKSVYHTIIRSPEDLPALRESKYLQSETRYTMKEVAELIKQNIPVLYVGTPCQIAGLKKVVPDSPLLLTVDIVCKCVPSRKAYCKYLDELSQGRKIKSVSFRDKSLYGWSTSLRVQFDDNTQYFRAEWKNEPYYKGFLGGIIDRKSCGHCQFAALPRQGDISLADFWGIHKMDPTWDDRYGTGMVLVNNEKGKKAFNAVKQQFLRCQEMPLDFAKANNPAVSRSWPEHAQRDRFFHMLDGRSFTQSMDYIINNKYDVGIMGFWIGTNYGTILTNYALNQFLTSKGLEVCMIDTCSGKPRDTDYPVYFEHRKAFEKKYYNIIAEPNLTLLNEHVHTFLIGSDQVWNYSLAKNFGHVLFLDFVSDENKKISYAASFGGDTFGNDGEYRRIAAERLKRFDAISVREVQGVDICRNQFGVEATHVLDPVFMCDRSRYDHLLEDSKIEIKEDYLFAYILDPTPQKRETLKRISREMGLKPVIVLDCEPWRYKEQKKKMDMDKYVRDNVFVEDFVALLSRSKAVITDSFHGTAFSIIYHRPFLAIANESRGFARFESLLGMLNLSDRLHYPYEELDVSLCINQLNTPLPDSVYDILANEKRRSDAWLNEALNKSHEKRDVSNMNDILYAQGCRLMRAERKTRELEAMVKKQNEVIEQLKSVAFPEARQSLISNLFKKKSQ